MFGAFSSTQHLFEGYAGVSSSMSNVGTTTSLLLILNTPQCFNIALKNYHQKLAQTENSINVFNKHTYLLKAHLIYKQDSFSYYKHNYIQYTLLLEKMFY